MGRITTAIHSIFTATGVTARGAKMNRHKICRKAGARAERRRRSGGWNVWGLTGLVVGPVVECIRLGEET